MVREEYLRRIKKIAKKAKKRGYFIMKVRIDTTKHYTKDYLDSACRVEGISLWKLAEDVLRECGALKEK